MNLFFASVMAWLAAAAALELAELQSLQSSSRPWELIQQQLDEVNFCLGQGLGPRGPRA